MAKKMAIALWCVLLLAGLRAQSGESSDVKKHLDAAKQSAGSEWSRAATFLCSSEQEVAAARLLPSQVGRDYAAQHAEPMKIFDNMYFLGQKTQASWALTSSDGIILIHAGYADQVEPNLIAGMKKLGLDPAQVKYVFMPHRVEEYAAARYFKDHYGSRIVLSAADWSGVEEEPRLSPQEEKAGNTPKPKRDVVAMDGQVFKLGDMQVTTVMIPGLTPGAVGFIFPVKDGGTPHMVGLFGGTILNPSARIPLATFQQYLRSIDHFSELTHAMNVDVEIAHHPIIDNTFGKMDRLRMRKPGEPHPFVVGEGTYAKYLTVMSECMKAQIARRGSANS